MHGKVIRMPVKNRALVGIQRLAWNQVNIGAFNSNAETRTTLGNLYCLWSLECHRSISLLKNKRICSTNQCPKIESTVKASMLNLKKLDFWPKRSGYATPKENINRISAIVDEEHFLVFRWQYSLFGTQVQMYYKDSSSSEASLPSWENWQSMDEPGLCHWKNLSFEHREE